jgi:hypothetical protein
MCRLYLDNRIIVSYERDVIMEEQLVMQEFNTNILHIYDDRKDELPCDITDICFKTCPLYDNCPRYNSAA